MYLNCRVGVVQSPAPSESDVAHPPAAVGVRLAAPAVAGSGLRRHGDPRRDHGRIRVDDGPRAPVPALGWVHRPWTDERAGTLAGAGGSAADAVDLPRGGGGDWRGEGRRVPGAVLLDGPVWPARVDGSPAGTVRADGAPIAT